MFANNISDNVAVNDLSNTNYDLNNIRKFCKKKPIEPILWYDFQKVEMNPISSSMLSRISNQAYNGIITSFENLKHISENVSNRLIKVINISSDRELTDLLEAKNIVPDLIKTNKLVVISENLNIVQKAKEQNLVCGLRKNIANAADLHSSIEDGKSFNYLILSFTDPTNIPLELVIASLEFTDTLLIKEITQHDDVDDAIVVSGVMEVGAEGIIFSPVSHKVLDQFIERKNAASTALLNIETGVVTLSKPIGMGYRGCIDLATLFTPEEGMLVGSTSQGGILCCPEVFYLPYMDLRPFRVNAGGIHSYIYNVNDKTDYMSELEGGDSLMIVGINGQVRQAPLGRIKIEMRPLRLIEVEFSGNKKVNVILQDDWHVRVFSDEGKPSNITEIKVGDKLLGYTADPGRHVGIKIKENIIEK